MNRIISLLSLLLIVSSLNAQLLPVKIYEITRVDFDGSWTTNVVGKEMSTFKIPSTANSLKLSLQVAIKDFMKYRLESQLRLFITNTETKEVIQNNYWSKLYKDTILVASTYFPAGKFDIQLIDNNDETKVFAKRSITVTSEKANVTGILIKGYTYDPSRMKVYACKSVDETNWKPVGIVSKIKVNGCVTFFFDSQEKINNPGTMRWKLYRLDATGKEVFVNQRDQNSRLEAWRWMYYEECDEFRSAGTYRIYFALKNESEAYYGVRDTDVFGMAQIEVTN